MQFSAKNTAIFICGASFFVLWQASQPSRDAPDAVTSLVRSPRHALRDVRDIFRRDTAWGNDTTYWAVTCTYSVSGVYTRFQRILFYFAMVFTFCARFHEWLTAFGIALIVTYSTTAALHGMALSFQQNVGTDLDYFAIIATLEPGLIGGTAFALYYPQILNTDPTLMFIAWSIFLGTAVLGMSATFPRYMTGLGDSAVMVACDVDWNCNDTCPLHDVHVPNVLFRSSLDNMVPKYLGPWITDDDTAITTPLRPADIGTSYTSTDTSAFKKTVSIIWVCGLVIRTTLVNLTYPPRQSRNRIVKLLTSKRTAKSCGFSRGRLIAAKAIVMVLYIWKALVFLIWPLTAVEFIFYMLILCWEPKKTRRQWIFRKISTRNEPSKCRLRIATGIALAWYVWACTAYILWPAIFIFSVCLSEVSLYGTPESEAIQNVGQWGPWVSAGLAVIVACVNKLFRNAKSKANPIYLNGREYQGIEKSGQTRNWMSRWESFVFLAEQWYDLKRWWKDPLEVSWSSSDDEKKSSIMRKRPEDKGEDEDRLLAWCKQDEEANIGYQDLLEKIVDRRMAPSRTCGWYLPEAKMEPEPGKEDASAADSNATDPWWALNNNYEIEEELHKWHVEKFLQRQKEKDLAKQDVEKEEPSAVDW